MTPSLAADPVTNGHREPSITSTAPHALRVPGHACDELCLAATGPATDCTCVCAGEHHGADHQRSGQPSSYDLHYARTGDPFVLMPAIDDEDDW